MEQCACVERELDKVLHKFLTYGQHCEQSLEELLHSVGQLRAELASAGHPSLSHAVPCDVPVLSEDQRHSPETGFRP